MQRTHSNKGPVFGYRDGAKCAAASRGSHRGMSAWLTAPAISVGTGLEALSTG